VSLSLVKSNKLLMQLKTMMSGFAAQLQSTAVGKRCCL
jgi:hypothetical protein